jgi:hypothetical protein
MISVRYDETTGTYRDCKWCKGKGCLACPQEADKEYKRQFPDGPKPILVVDPHTEEGLDKLTSFLTESGMLMRKDDIKKLLSPESE